jgi:hypothetical protein
VIFGVDVIFGVSVGVSVGLGVSLGVREGEGWGVSMIFIVKYLMSVRVIFPKLLQYSSIVRDSILAGSIAM